MSLQMGPVIKARAAMTDKGFDSEANWTACRSRDIMMVIPHRDNAKNRPNYFPKALHRRRACIEQAMGKLKRFKRVPLRCNKTPTSYSAIIAFACAIILVKLVHMA